MTVCRYKLTIEYVGTAFCGWQTQGTKPTVQRTLINALHALGEPVQTVYGAGRTDAGVHALGQVAHVDMTHTWEAFRLQQGINAPQMRKKWVSVVSCVPVTSTFHARFSAVLRHYVYCIINRSPLLALDQARAWHVPQKLDLKEMKKAIECFRGTHDFSSFRSAKCQSLFSVKTIEEIAITARGYKLFIHIASPSFLHHQARFMVGALKWIGEGHWTINMLKKYLQNPTFTGRAPVAPAHGLYLTQIDYTNKKPHLLDRFF